MIEIKTSEMATAGVQYGHQKNRRNPSNIPFITTEHQGVQIFDLSATAKHLAAALSFLQKLKKEGKTILIVGTKFQATQLVEELAAESHMPYINSRWLGGFLTNFEEIKKRIAYYNSLRDAEKSGELDKYTKKEKVAIHKKMSKLTSYLHGVRNVDKLPDAILVFDIVRDHIPVVEAKLLGIPVVGICDTDADIRQVAYPIPGNDDAISSLRYFASMFKQAMK